MPATLQELVSEGCELWDCLQLFWYMLCLAWPESVIATQKTPNNTVKDQQQVSSLSNRQSKLELLASWWVTNLVLPFLRQGQPFVNMSTLRWPKGTCWTGWLCRLLLILHDFILHANASDLVTTWQQTNRTIIHSTWIYAKLLTRL